MIYTLYAYSFTSHIRKEKRMDPFAPPPQIIPSLGNVSRHYLGIVGSALILSFGLLQSAPHDRDRIPSRLRWVYGEDQRYMHTYIRYRVGV